jgi:copper chaperone CopZ
MAVGRLPGIGKVSGGVEPRTITVEYEPPTITVEAIQQALEKVGYDSTVVA